MITKTLYDYQGIKAGCPIVFMDFIAGDQALVKLPGGKEVIVPADAVDAHEPEESLPALAEKLGIPYDTLVKYAREGKILARKSGGVWLSTARAIEAAGIKPR
jgi:hypothetical protein